MDFDVAGVDHQPFNIRLVDQLLQKFFPDAFIAPAAEAAMRIFPIAIVGRQVAPGCSAAQDPENTVEKTPIILGDAAPQALLSRKMSGEQFPGLIAQVVTVICCWMATHLNSFAYRYIS